MSEHGERRSVELPADIFSRIEDRVESTEFEDVNEYITHVLEEVLHQTERNHELSAGSIDEQQVEERLKSLGYLNE